MYSRGRVISGRVNNSRGFISCIPRGKPSTDFLNLSSSFTRCSSKINVGFVKNFLDAIDPSFLATVCRLLFNLAQCAHIKKQAAPDATNLAGLLYRHSPGGVISRALFMAMIFCYLLLINHSFIYSFIQLLLSLILITTLSLIVLLLILILINFNNTNYWFVPRF